MDDPYRIRPNRESGAFDPPSKADSTSPAGEPHDWVTGALWAALAVFVGLNAVFSIIRPDDIGLSLMFGIPGVLCLAVLVMRYLGRRHS